MKKNLCSRERVWLNSQTQPWRLAPAGSHAAVFPRTYLSAERRISKSCREGLCNDLSTDSEPLQSQTYLALTQFPFVYGAEMEWWSGGLPAPAAAQPKETAEGLLCTAARPAGAEPGVLRGALKVAGALGG